MQKPAFSRDAGYTVTEILIILVVLGILVTLSVAQFGRSRENLNRQNIAREFKVSLERARFDSVKRHANVCSDMSQVTINSATSFSVSTDMNQNGRLDLPGETNNISFGNLGDVTLIGNGITLPVTIRFDERGRAFLQADCDPSSTPTASVPLFYFCNGACTVATATSQNANAIFISPTGTVAMMTGDSSVPTFTDPTVTTVATGTGVDNRLTVWTGTPPSPTPFPTPSQATPTPLPTGSGTPTPSATPTATPSGTPTPTPSGTPTPTPSATPTPTPSPTPTPIRSCAYNEKPHGSPASCICRAPMYAGSGGKCVGPSATPTP